MEDKIKGSELFSNLLERSTIVNFNTIAGTYSQKYSKDNLVEASALFSKLSLLSLLYWEEFHNIKDFSDDAYDIVLELIEKYNELNTEIYEWEKDNGDVSNIFSEVQWKEVLKNISFPKNMLDSEKNKEVLDFWASDNGK